MHVISEAAAKKLECPLTSNRLNLRGDCAGSRCMAWRKVAARTETDPKNHTMRDVPYKEPHGHCALIP